MKTITVPVADDLYQKAIQKAAAEDTSLPEVVQDLLTGVDAGKPASRAFSY